MTPTLHAFDLSRIGEQSDTKEEVLNTGRSTSPTGQLRHAYHGQGNSSQISMRFRGVL